MIIQPGVFLLEGFAAGWAFWGSFGLRPMQRIATAFCAVLISAGAILAVAQGFGGHLGGAWGRNTPAFVWSCAFEIILIPIAAVWCFRTGRPSWFITAALAIVGLHFFGLIAAFGSAFYGVLGSALVILAAGTAKLPVPAKYRVSGFGAAALLWVCGVMVG